jgi:HK97 family phage major capsid protein
MCCAASKEGANIMNATITRLQEQRQAQVDFIASLLASVEQENRDLVEAEQQNITNAETRMAEIDAQLEPLVAFEQRRASAAQIPAGLIGGHSEPQRSSVQVTEHRSLGQIYTESEEFRSYSGRGTSGVVRVEEFRAVGPDPLLTTTEPGLKLLPNAQKFAQTPRQVKHPLLSLVGRIEVSGNSVSFISTSEPAGADVVPEGGAKPAVHWTAVETPYTLETIAGWFKYSRQALADIPQLRSLIDQKIRRAIDIKLNALAATALTTGVGAGSTVTGASGASIEAVVREAIAELEEFGVASTGVLVNPADHAAFDLAMLGKPLGSAQVQGGMWGVPIVPVSAIAAGTAYIGDISEALVYFERVGLEMYTTDSDISGDGSTAASDFRKNILTTLGEVRGKFALVDQSVIRKVVVTP